ncbi:MAG TPA: hypothetical protein VHO84_12080 [Syntrophorhabdaceae bacterium]|nr:hypothetical protein [Syntrophorhabdaceae bacterium]
MKHVTHSVLLLAVCILICAATPLQEPATIVPVGQDGVQRIEVIGGSYFFKPSHIVVKVNTPVELVVSKESGFTPHDIVAGSPDAGIDFKVDLSSAPKVIRFVPIKVGVYPVYCDKKAPFSKSHKEKGMEGIIEVVP